MSPFLTYQPKPSRNYCKRSKYTTCSDVISETLSEITVIKQFISTRMKIISFKSPSLYSYPYTFSAIVIGGYSNVL